MNFKKYLFTTTVLIFAQASAHAASTTIAPTTSLFQPYKENSIAQKTMAFNIGFSRLDTSNYQGPSASGLSFEGQYAFLKKVLGTAAFFHYDYAGESDNSNFQMAALGAELQPIQTEVFKGAQFFAAVTTGGAYIFDVNNGFNLFYGAGLGLKINSDIGLRFDIKSGRNYITSNTISLIGYY